MIAPDPAPAAARPAARPESAHAEAPNRDRPESGGGTDFGAVVAERPARRGAPDARRAEVEPPPPVPVPVPVPVPLLSPQVASPLPADAVASAMASAAPILDPPAEGRARHRGGGTAA